MNEHPVYHLASGAYDAEIASFSGGIKALSFRGEPLVETYPTGEFPPLSAGVVLAPWPNRTEDGRFSWRGKDYQLDINEPERSNAIHGFAQDAQWELLTRRPDAVTLGLDITPRNGWPWPLRIAASYVLSAHGLRVRFRATTSSPEPVPYAFGLHTYLSARGADEAECTIAVPVTHHHPLDARNLPTGEQEPAEVFLPGITRGVQLRGRLLDDCFSINSGVDAAAAGVVLDSDRPDSPGACAAVYTGASGRGVRMDMGPGLRWVQMFTPDERLGCPYPGRGRALAVEPMSAPPNALRTGIDLRTLSYDHPVTFELGLRAV
ncbi:MAG: aldose 1-epimerase family protein [Corynebacterium sp.]|nr:aldose 1-epimerase family protein [Corynebacterium sp.]